MTVSFAWLIGACSLALAAYLVYNRLGRGLDHIPGPGLAGYIDLWRLVSVWQRRPELTLLEQHRKVSISDPRAIKAIYAPKARFVKVCPVSLLYLLLSVQQTIAKGEPLQSLFNTTNESYHGKLRRGAANAYAMRTLIQFEPLVDSTTRAFLDQMDARYADKQGVDDVCDIGTWLQFYAFDVIGALTFSKRLGFIDQGIDVDSIIGNLERLLNYLSVVGQLPFLDRLILKNPSRMAERMTLIAPEKEGNHPLHNGQARLPRDFLSRFLEAQIKDPDFFDSQRVLALTVAISLRGHPAAGLPLERLVPAKGVSILDQWLPGGTIVGCSAWTVHKDERIFGANPDVLRPERWLEATTEQAKEMAGCLFSFGSGTRSCIGRNISLLEMYKLVPTVLVKYNISLENEESTWNIHNAWFVKQSGFHTAGTIYTWTGTLCSTSKTTLALMEIARIGSMTQRTGVRSIRLKRWA
ncbi:cytochrome P450 [Aspergillus spectabilis]